MSRKELWRRTRKEKVMGDSLLKDQPKSDPEWLKEKREQLQKDLATFQVVTAKIPLQVYEAMKTKGDDWVVTALEDAAKWSQRIPDDLHHWVENMGAAWVNDTLGEKAAQMLDVRRKTEAAWRDQAQPAPHSLPVGAETMTPQERADLRETEARTRWHDALTEEVQARTQRILMKNRRNEQRTP